MSQTADIWQLCAAGMLRVCVMPSGTDIRRVSEANAVVCLLTLLVALCRSEQLSADGDEKCVRGVKMYVGEAAVH